MSDEIVLTDADRVWADEQRELQRREVVTGSDGKACGLGMRIPGTRAGAYKAVDTERLRKLLKTKRTRPSWAEEINWPLVGWVIGLSGLWSFVFVKLFT